MDDLFDIALGWPDVILAGVDEAGRGAWAGPVVAAATILPFECRHLELNDSKRLTAKQRQALYEQLKHVPHGIGIASVEEIDQLNILQASFLAMQRAVICLPYPPMKILVDGSQLPSLPCPAESVIGGDGLSPSIAAASILAKVTRDEIMTILDDAFPYYGWKKNKGYGVKQHREGLHKYGVSFHHRKTYAPIRKLLKA